MELTVKQAMEIIRETLCADTEPIYDAAALEWRVTNPVTGFDVWGLSRDDVVDALNREFAQLREHVTRNPENAIVIAMDIINRRENNTTAQAAPMADEGGMMTENGKMRVYVSGGIARGGKAKYVSLLTGAELIDGEIVVTPEIAAMLAEEDVEIVEEEEE